MGKADTSKRGPLRDQKRALHAYKAVHSVPPGDRKDYEIAVNGLGANILRSGLCAALASVQRLGRRGDCLLGHLASAGVPGLEGTTEQDLAERVSKLDVDSYMIASREMLKVATWLKRAMQAKSEES